MSADEVAQDMVTLHSRRFAPWGPGCWNRPISLSLGLIINWSVILMRDGMQRVARNHAEELWVG